MPKFGAHESISGGLENAVLTASALGFDTVQLFSKNSNQWKAKPIDNRSVQKFRDAMSQTGIVSPLIHDSYLINLASPKTELFEKSLAAFHEEIERAAALGVRQLVMHPGSYTEDTEENGLKRIAAAFDTIFQSVPDSVLVLLETTAGQGTNLGYKFEQLAEIIAQSSYPERFGVCIDTCHVFAAGYDISTQKGYDQVMNNFDRILGLERLKAFHLNDSVKGLGSRVDRHTHLGHGTLGVEPFGFIVNDPRLAELPMYLETPKGETEVNGKLLDWDVVNLRTLKSLIK
ncbi:MAG: deoxyribonuclease IV [Thermoguttaceae bacterium]|nr:deoxyribonuclease IV [Thermoguttaceae bacterium]